MSKKLFVRIYNRKFLYKVFRSDKRKKSKINIKIYISHGKKANLKKNTDTICDSRSAAWEKEAKTKRRIYYVNKYLYTSPMYIDIQYSRLQCLFV